MALKALLIGRKLAEKRSALAALLEKNADFDMREAKYAAAIEEVTEATSAEERAGLESEIDEFEQERSAHNDAVAALQNEIRELENDLAAEEARQNTTPPAAAETAPAEHERRENSTMSSMNTRARIFRDMTPEQRSALVQRQDVQDYLTMTRTAIREKRALTNVGLTVPDVLLGLLRENLENYSKLLKHVTVRNVRGEARQNIMGTVPEAIWTDCCANLNELTMAFYGWEFDCYKVSGYFTICNANLEDSDLDLLAELLIAMDQAIGLALDKAILYGRNTNTALKMPMGIMTRLAQTAAPSGYPATARPWADLHSSNLIAIGTAQAPKTGLELFKALILGSGAIKGKHATRGKTWCMNETTLTKLQAEGLAVNAAGAIVSGFGTQMPVIGGEVETLEFIPNDVVIGGYFENYVLVERAGKKFATSEHVRFLQDETVMKGTARYDGAPVIAEAFAAFGIGGTAPAATGVTFPQDTANAGE